ncbi:GTP-binding protein [Tenacibaculum sp. Bg11-29]|uniref:GTP-binding protein n=1 Tax=Tenacibaculum sp. Bg11-29 TaxID=2058306 RepID=UPI000C326E9D|nr:GTP-binding protein [Tenacibaculum sp. Bg11-29]PKH49396.1 GTP-binding protein [Tenacibaculum sp. Bg11-29]
MEDQLYNQIFLKPRFQIDFEMNSEVLMSEIKNYLSDETRYKMKVVDTHVIIDIPDKETHFWSPQLSLEIESITEETSKIKGLFGPKPQVWTFFMFLHFVVATAFLIFGVIAYTNWSLQKGSIFPIVMLVVLPIVWVILYFAGTIGRSTGEKQMKSLKNFTKLLLKKIN